jgi:hypothetical protein
MAKIQHVYKSKREDIIGQTHLNTQIEEQSWMDSVYLREGEIDRRITSPAQELVHVGATLESDSENIGATL